MRQIITQSPSSGSPTSNTKIRDLQKQDRMGINSMGISTCRGETDSSFEVPDTNMNSHYVHLLAKGVSTKSRSQRNNGSTEFAPADHRIHDKFVATPETSWDVLANDSEICSNCNKSATAKTVIPSPLSARRTSGRQSGLPNKSREKQQFSECSAYISAVSSSVDDNARSATGGSRIARLASMFSSRALPVAVPMQASIPREQRAVPSPPRSESSNGYVGWPGTQDEQGVTVVADSSYEESDISAGNHGLVTSPLDKVRAMGDQSEIDGSNLIMKPSYSTKHGHLKIHQLGKPAECSQSTNSFQKQMRLPEDSAEGKKEETMSDLSTSYSKASSAYFNLGEVEAIQKGDTEQIFGVNQNKNRLAAATVMRRCLSSSIAKPHLEQSPLQTLTEERLAMNNRITAPSRSFNNTAAAGYRGLLDRTKDVPNLIDDTCSDYTSASTTVTARESKYNESRRTLPGPASLSSSNHKHKLSKELEHKHASTIEGKDENDGLLGASSRTSMEILNLALLGGGLTTIQTTKGDFTNRKTASDFDETLTNSDCDQYGFAKIPAFHKMVSAGMNHHDRSFTSQSLEFALTKSHQQQPRPRKKYMNKYFAIDDRTVRSDYRKPVGDLSQYLINPESMRTLVKKFRKLSFSRYQYSDYENLVREDATKAFALSEMRSRIMEKDIERGLERRGGTTVVDDIVMTSYHKAALRVRDAVIVAKAWRDGATPQDIIKTANLTRCDKRGYCIPRLYIPSIGDSRCTWEDVDWVDDNTLPQYRCHSLGPRHLRGVEMFTIGDCQSILLKLSNERCQELKAELNEATTKQIEAEGAMKEEGETFDRMMTEAEMTYLTSMEDVKLISQKLVLAEKSFALVKNRIQKLVAKYEALLIHFENETESVAPSSVFSYESSCYSEEYSIAAANEVLARRARRAELHAELIARESLLSNQKSSSSCGAKEKEVDNLKARIAELQSDSSTHFTNRDHSVVLTTAINLSNQNNRVTSECDNGGRRNYRRSKIYDIKQRFRNRSAAKFQFNNNDTTEHVQLKKSPPIKYEGTEVNNNIGNNLYRTVGEEMFQHLDFYERSLKSVQGQE